MVLSCLLQVCHSVQDMAVSFVYLATTDDNPEIKTLNLPKSGNHGLENETCCWFSYSHISGGDQGEFPTETKEIISKVEQGIN